MTSLSGNQSGYQGYPYTTPIVTEVQSVGPGTAPRWSNLPRNQITTGRGGNQNRNTNLIHGSSRPDQSHISTKKEAVELPLNVNKGLPIVTPEQMNQRRNEMRRVQNNSDYQGYPYRNPTVTEVQSIDPETAFKWAHLPRKPITDGRENQNRNNLGHGSPKLDQKPNTEEPPMNIYIDLPIIDSHEMNGRQDEGSSGETNSGFVEDTIFYDPFEDRRINVSRNQDSQITDTPGSIPGPKVPETRTTIAGSSSGSNPIRPDVTQTQVPPLMSKETYIYGLRTEDDSFPLSPIPVSEFPEPPPAYSEVESRTDSEPPRTVVVVPDRNATVGIASGSRKLLLCPHCGLQVNTLPVQENGPLTHVLAFIFLFIFLPLTLLIYCTDWCKYKNHYCPNCNQLIGYEVPIICQDMIYIKP